ncbi:MAG: very short patch repair endonuclease [Boseongicola sp.]|nr:very short patch repair endonuclease [Boseongicola sp.]
MVDNVRQTTRSRIMSRVGIRNTGPERALRRGVHQRGFRFRLHVKGLPGTPDLVFPRFQAVCFVHGCFWHRHAGCSRSTEPGTRIEFWQEKFRKNVERDQRTKRKLLDDGWRVAVVWECVLGTREIGDSVDELCRWLQGAEQEGEIPRCGVLHTRDHGGGALRSVKCDRAESW